MNIRTLSLAASVFLLVGLGSHLLGSGDTRFEERSAQSGIGDLRTLQAAYDRWAAAYTLSGGDQRLVLPLGYTKGLSAEFTGAHGQAEFDLMDGSVSVTVFGLPEGVTFDVWLIDNRPGPGHSVRPEPGDALVGLGSLRRAADPASLEGNLAEVSFPGFEIDLVVVVPAGEHPGEAGLLFGTPSLFQKLYYDKPGGRLAALGGAEVPGHARLAQRESSSTNPFSTFISRPAHATGPGQNSSVLAALIETGRDVFLNETFEGNGRTCGSCHPAQNNFTIDPEFIATLPDTDPLFVAEFVPELKENFEDPKLMRQHGLILENVDGSDLLQTKFVMRGVPHTLALGTSIDFSDGFVTVPHLGWSGDGGAGDGSLRLFAVGAVFQHFPKTLDREDANQDPVSPDFRFPDDSELDAMEAFQLSLGRAEDLDLLAMDFIDPVPPLPSVTAGLQAFLDVGCNNCHFDAGANVDPASPIGSGNANFDTNVEEFFQNGQAHHGKRPFDGGFGPRPAVAGTCPATGCGNGAFNPPSLVEAADTSPFFHNNSVTTIEEAVAFYLSDDFKDSPTGFMVQNFNADQVADMAAFLRVLNVLENIRSAEESSEGASKSHEPQEASALARAAGFEIEDAIEVLTIEGVELYPGAVTCLLDAGVFLEEAGETEHYPTRKQLIGEAIGELGCARDEMIL